MLTTGGARLPGSRSELPIVFDDPLPAAGDDAIVCAGGACQREESGQLTRDPARRELLLQGRGRISPPLPADLRRVRAVRHVQVDDPVISLRARLDDVDATVAIHVDR